MTEKSSAFPAGSHSGNPARLLSNLSWRHIAYYFGVPLVFAVYAGLNNWEMQQIAGFPASILFYSAHSLLPWWLTCATTTLSMKALSRWKPPWLILLLLGHTISSLLVVPYSSWLAGIYEARWHELKIAGEFAPVFSNDVWMYLRAGIVWIGVNFVFDRFVGLPLYRYQIPRGYEAAENGKAVDVDSQSGWGERPPGFLGKLPAILEPSEILAIKAEQHYIRVYTPNKEYMILYRFSDAVRSLDESLGQQVHRSFWVNTSAIESVHPRAKEFYIRISTGTDIPVSTPYQGMVRELARSARIPLRN